jgi:hypothetical protein
MTSSSRNIYIIKTESSLDTLLFLFFSFLAHLLFLFSSPFSLLFFFSLLLSLSPHSPRWTPQIRSPSNQTNRVLTSNSGSSLLPFFFLPLSPSRSCVHRGGLGHQRTEKKPLGHSLTMPQPSTERREIGSSGSGGSGSWGKDVYVGGGGGRGREGEEGSECI